MKYGIGTLVEYKVAGEKEMTKFDKVSSLVQRKEGEFYEVEQGTGLIPENQIVAAYKKVNWRKRVKKQEEKK